MEEMPHSSADPGRRRPPPPPSLRGGGGGGGGGRRRRRKPPREGGILRRVFTGIASSILIFSLVLNVYFLVMFAAMSQHIFEETYDAGTTLDRIVILPIEGVIDEGMSRFVDQALRQLTDDPPKAVVLRVDSPGGGVGASDRIAKRIRDFKEATNVPVVASFGSVAASGGYYVSAGADEIYAEPTTITGSIGVIAQAFTAGELMTKLGIKPETIIATESTSKDVMDWTRDWTDGDRQMLRKFLDHSHERFVEVVYEGRKDHLTPEAVKALATGEPYTADQAIEDKLVDQSGYLDDAIEAAKKRAGMAMNAQPRITRFAQPQGLFGGLAGVSGGDSPAKTWSDAAGVRKMLIELARPQLEYRLVW